MKNKGCLTIFALGELEGLQIPYRQLPDGKSGRATAKIVKDPK